MIAVFDTNELIAAIIDRRGLFAKLLHRARSREFSLVSCPFIMSEIQRILSKKFRLSHDETAAAMELLSVGLLTMSLSTTSKLRIFAGMPMTTMSLPALLAARRHIL